ncbi:response regulator transcription factor [Francisellaceae bacterium]|nr:response regulator transcription factor [Francisellaceae bacterium]
MKVLVIEDDKQVREFIIKGFKEHGHTVYYADNGKDGLFLATTDKFDILIVDRLLPELDGLTIIKTIRGAGNLSPVIILSALGEVDDRITGLRSGSDDYLVKPFAFDELLARSEALVRRISSAGKASQETVLTCGDVELNLLSREVKRAGKTVPLQSREFKLLEYLIQHKGQVVTRTMLLENVWDYHFDPQTNVIDVHVSRMRNKLNEGFEEDAILTIRGAGYMIKE